MELTWLVADTLDYLMSISAIDQQLAQQYRGTVMSIGAAAVRDGFDSQHGCIYETGLPVTGPVSTVKVWWVQAESVLALWKLHEHSQSSDGSAAAAATATGSDSEAAPGTAAGGGQEQHRQQHERSQSSDDSPAATWSDSEAAPSTAAGAGGQGRHEQQSYYLHVLAQTARFVRQYLTDDAGGGELFWQVEADGSYKPTKNLERSTKGNMWKVCGGSLGPELVPVPIAVFTNPPNAPLLLVRDGDSAHSFASAHRAR